LPKIVDEVKPLAPAVYLVKFKLEVGRTREELIDIARRSRERSDADLIVANDKATFGPGRHPAIMLDREGIVAETATQDEMADRLAEILAVRVRREVSA
jgi:phosphopantothenate-cysteine ligase